MCVCVCVLKYTKKMDGWKDKTRKLEAPNYAVLYCNTYMAQYTHSLWRVKLKRERKTCKRTRKKNGAAKLICLKGATLYSKERVHRHLKLKPSLMFSWYTKEKAQNTSFHCSISSSTHSFKPGPYCFHLYCLVIIKHLYSFVFSGCYFFFLFFFFSRFFSSCCYLVLNTERAYTFRQWTTRCVRLCTRKKRGIV